MPLWFSLPAPRFPRVHSHLCDGCGVCVDACPRHLLEIADGKARTVKGHEERCGSCGGCIAVCRGGALRLHGKAA